MGNSNYGIDFLLGLGTNFLATLIGVLVAIYLRDRWYYRRLYEGWKVRILYKDHEVLRDGRSLGWATAKAIAESQAEESVLLKGIVSPYARLHCDLITEGRTMEILREDDTPRTFLGRVRGKRRVYTIDLSRGEAKKLLVIEPLTRRILGLDGRETGDSVAPPAPVAAPPAPAAAGTLVLNFAHPLTGEHLVTIEQITGQPVGEVRDEPTQARIDGGRPLAPQVTAMVDGLGLSPREWQTVPILVNLPGYAPTAAAMLAELHGRMGHFPAIIRLRPIAATTPTRYEVAEIADLRETRDAARAERRQ